MLTNAIVDYATTTFSTCNTTLGLMGCATAVGSATIPEISNDPDYTSLIVVGGNLFTITQFEAPVPSVMYLTQLVQDPTTGVLSAKPNTMVPINWSAYGGILATCAGSTTPWQSHLGSEESYMQDGRDWAGTMFGTVTAAQGFNTIALGLSESLNSFTSVTSQMRYFGIYPNQMTTANVIANINPYMYGYITEVKVQGQGQYTVAKHFWMGRQGWEMAYVMPDLKTTYGGVDVNNGGFYKMVANTASDLSGGSLYCAQMAATGQAASFAVTWKLMSTTTNAAMLALLNTTLTGSRTVAPTQITFDDIFLTALPTSATSGACPTGFTSTNVNYYYTVNGVTYRNECLMLNPATPNAALLAAVVETPRYAGMLGCTTEFNKFEGMTFSRRRNQLFAALSYWSATSSMSGPLVATPTVQNNADIGGSQDLSIPWNANYGCGCVFYLNTDSNYNIYSMAPLVCGIAQSADANGNTCSPLSISAPDNVAMIEDFDTLMVRACFMRALLACIAPSLTPPLPPRRLARTPASAATTSSGSTPSPTRPASSRPTAARSPPSSAPCTARSPPARSGTTWATARPSSPLCSSTRTESRTRLGASSTTTRPPLAPPRGSASSARSTSTSAPLPAPPSAPPSLPLRLPSSRCCCKRLDSRNLWRGGANPRTPSASRMHCYIFKSVFSTPDACRAEARRDS